MTNRVITFFEKVGSTLKKLFTSHGWETKAIATINYVAPMVETIVALTAGGPAATIVANVVNIVKADLATVATVCQDGMPAPGSTAAQTVTSALNSVKSNLTELLADADVKNSAKAEEITAVTTTIIGEANALLSSLTPAPSAS